MKTYEEKELKESYVAIVGLFEDLLAYWSSDDLHEAISEARTISEARRRN